MLSERKGASRGLYAEVSEALGEWRDPDLRQFLASPGLHRKLRVDLMLRPILQRRQQRGWPLEGTRPICKMRQPKLSARIAPTVQSRSVTRLIIFVGPTPSYSSISGRDDAPTDCNFTPPAAVLHLDYPQPATREPAKGGKNCQAGATRASRTNRCPAPGEGICRRWRGIDRIVKFAVQRDDAEDASYPTFTVAIRRSRN